MVGIVSGGEGSEGAELSKRLAKVDGEIAELRKAEGEPGTAVAIEKLEGARRDLQRAYLERHSGYPGSTTAKADAARRAA